MKKENLVMATYLLFSVGLFALAIEMWICGSSPTCRESNSLVSNIAKATITTVIPDYSNTGWSGPDNPDFSINFSGTSTPIPRPPVSSDSDGDGH